MRLQLLSLLALPFVSISYASEGEQIVMTDPIYVPQTTSKPTLADLLTIESSASIFYSYARETPLSEIFGDESVHTTLLVPTNKAVMALARKPHQGPAPIDDEIEISEQEFDARSKKNVERWVSAHIIPQSPIVLESQTYDTLLSGKSVTFKPLPKADPSAPEWTRVLLDGDIHIIGVKEGLNGVIYLIDSTIAVD